MDTLSAGTHIHAQNQFIAVWSRFLWLFRKGRKNTLKPESEKKKKHTWQNLDTHTQLLFPEVCGFYKTISLCLSLLSSQIVDLPFW